MGKKFPAFLLGFFCSLGGLVVWVIIGLLGFYAGIGAFLMAYLFVAGYQGVLKKPDDKSYIPLMIFVVIIDIVLALIVFIAIDCYRVGVPFSIAVIDLLDMSVVLLDLAIGLVFGAIGIFMAISQQSRQKARKQFLADKKKRAAEAQQEQDQNQIQNPNQKR
ncbi:MAG: hypothetical protein LBT20_00380 [Clostridiales bacterium]|jgi:hypothetical protein|nr:hypothetical protein [Clostridiales bacterium]